MPDKFHTFSKRFAQPRHGCAKSQLTFTRSTELNCPFAKPSCNSAIEASYRSGNVTSVDVGSLVAVTKEEIANAAIPATAETRKVKGLSIRERDAGFHSLLLTLF